MQRNLVIELSNTFTLAPKPIADLAANSPTVPAPIITKFKTSIIISNIIFYLCKFFKTLQIYFIVSYFISGELGKLIPCLDNFSDMGKI